MNIRTCFKAVLSATALLLTAACGGGDSAAAPPATVVVAISGLAANTTIILQNNGTDALSVAMDGSASFGTPVTRGASYMVTVLTQPAGQRCTVSNANGTAADAAVINVSVDCNPVRYLYVAYGFSNSIAAFAINESTGVLTPIQGPIAASGDEPDLIALNPDGKSLYLAYHCDAGTVCEKEGMQVSEYSINDNDGTLSHLREISLEGRGPSSMVIDPANRFAYFLDAEDISGVVRSSISVANIDPTAVGAPQIPGNPFRTSAPASSLAIGPDGRFLYVGDAGISVYAVDPATGAITIVSESPAPTPFSYAIAIDAQGKFAYVSDSANAISSYAIDPVTGLLTAVSVNQQASNPSGGASVSLTPDGKFAYVVYGQAIWGYAIDSGTGAVAAVSRSPFATGVDPGSFAIDSSGKYAFVNTEDGTLTSYSINSSSGILSPITGAVAQIGSGASVMTVR